MVDSLNSMAPVWLLSIVAGTSIFMTALIISLMSRGDFGQIVRQWAIKRLKLGNNELGTLKDTEEVLEGIRDAVVAQLINDEPLLFNAIAKQRIILANQDRQPVAIFLSVDTFKSLLTNTLDVPDPEKVDGVYDALRMLNLPVGHLGVLPIYISDLLKAAPIYVAGGIKWSLNRD